MLIDTHCHIDQFSQPEEIVRQCERESIRVIAVTSLPSHFAIAADRLRGGSLVTAALGLHPLLASKGIRELTAFKRMIPYTDFVGEIGLDFSIQGRQSKAVQERVFEELLQSMSDRPRFITLHSRRAERAVLEALQRHKICRAVFHWFTGSATELSSVLDRGHYLSINPAMLSTKAGQRILMKAPQTSILVESDGPFAKFRGKPCCPNDTIVVYQALADEWRTGLEQAIQLVSGNFHRLIETIKINPLRR